MSYLLDALKQSSQDQGAAQVGLAAQAQYSQQKDLQFYRRLVVTLGLVLTLIVGFLAGKWYQEWSMNKQLMTANTLVVPVRTEIAPSANENIKVPADVPQTSSKSLEPVTQPEVVTKPVKEQLVEDYSQYKVVGKPLEQPSAVPAAELAAVPDTLKAAFAQAVAQTENQQEYEVTQGSSTSSRVQPLELLPDVILARVPSLRYQAHIYATQADKRWIRINNRDLYEGDMLDNLKIIEIAPEQTVMNMDGYQFSLAAMQDFR
ncbi:general secretion pathway protein GspB [Pseudoalteromonas ulvae]|uniref:Type II secretion system protein GspB C-terminal domain-containing protein n=1 Tax=Pseudoalteromonas ulvae TaxID=107327 RepID=A0A244CQ57_PSEDV|nr:general secretion pathway protein GspB [Pseudoalteromonas ulvae]OUL57753.1 hypothetical protein B1199_11910 [Pseudoalteromonas ulvae]